MASLDILKVLKSYLQNQNSEDTNSFIYDLALKFGAYKNIDYYMLLTSNKVQSNLIHIYSSIKIYYISKTSWMLMWRRLMT